MGISKSIKINLYLREDRIYDFVNGCFTVFVPVILYGVYTYNGNTLNLSAMAMANLMMGRINGRMN